MRTPMSAYSMWHDDLLFGVLALSCSGGSMAMALLIGTSSKVWQVLESSTQKGGWDGGCLVVKVYSKKAVLACEYLCYLVRMRIPPST